MTRSGKTGETPLPSSEMRPLRRPSSRTKHRQNLESMTISTWFISLLIIAQILSAQANDHYGDPSEVQGRNDGRSDHQRQVYDPVHLQRSINNDNNPDSVEENFRIIRDSTMESLQNMSSHQLSMVPVSLELENATLELINNMKELSNIDMAIDRTDKGKIATINATVTPKDMTSKSILPNGQARTTIIREDNDASISDYIDDDDGDSFSDYQQHQEPIVNNAPQSPIKTQPLAMKLYQPLHEQDNTLKTHPQEQQQQQQQQPISTPFLNHRQHLQEHFHNHTDDDYYEDSPSHVHFEQFLKERATKAPSTTALPPIVATMPESPLRSTAHGAASIPSFQLPLAVAWTTAANAMDATVTTTSALSSVTIAEDDTAHSTTAPTISTDIKTESPMARTTTSSSSSQTTAPITMRTTTTAPEPSTTHLASSQRTSRPGASKQGKQLNISRRKMLPRSQLHDYIRGDNIRKPLAVIMDPLPELLEKTKVLWRAALQFKLNINIFLIVLNASETPAIYSFNNTDQFLSGLNGIKENDIGGNVLLGLSYAHDLVPYDSVVFLSTATAMPFTEKVANATINLFQKRLRLYVLWYGDQSINDNVAPRTLGGSLGELAIRTGGAVLHIIGDENSQEIEGNNLALVADTYRGPQEIDVPVDTTLSSLHVKVDRPMRTVTLETTNGG